jgi:hypothetical protein
MPTRANPSPTSDEQVRALLERYKCPVPFHEVRTRFLGNIASPVMSTSPIKVVQELWGGELPPFGTIDDANELIGALVMGLSAPASVFRVSSTRCEERVCPRRTASSPSALGGGQGERVG